MTNRKIAALETRKKLLEAGKRIICKKGLDNTAVEEITEAAGVSKGTFYTYFRRKEDIVFELSRQVFGRISGKCETGGGRLSGQAHGLYGQFFRIYRAGRREAGPGLGKECCGACA